MRSLTLFFILVDVTLSHAGLVKHSRRDGGGDHDGRGKRGSLGLLSSLLEIPGDQSTNTVAINTQTNASPTTPHSSPPSTTPPSTPRSSPPSSTPSSPSTPTSSHISSLNLSGSSKIPQASADPTVPSSGSVPPTIAATEVPANTPTPSTTSLSAGSKHTSHASLIAGVLVPLLILMLAAALFVIHRRRRRWVRPSLVPDGANPKHDADQPPPGAPASDASTACKDEEYSSQGCDSADCLPVLSEKDSETALRWNAGAASSDDATRSDSPPPRGRTSHALSRAPTFASHWSRETVLPPYVRPLPTIPPLSTMPPLPAIPPT